MPPKDNQESPLGRMRRRLYSPEETKTPSFSSILKGRTPKAPEGWKQDETPVLATVPPKKKIPTPILFLLGAGGFFVLAAIVTAVILFLGGRSLSSNNLEIIIEGPTTIEGGEQVPLLLTIKNNNPLPVTDATLSIVFPDGVYVSPDQSEPLKNISEELGRIEAGASARTTIRAAFFGEESQKFSIPITVEYRTENSNAVFIQEKMYEVILGSSSVSLSIESLKEISSGQQFTLAVRVRSNAQTPLENVALKLSKAPFGFTRTKSNIEPIGEDIFPLGTFAPGEEKELRLTGTLIGQDGDQRVFTFVAGALGGSDTGAFSLTYIEESAEVTIAKPFLATRLSVNRNEEPTIVVPSNAPIDGLITWKNTLSAPITDAVIDIAFSGEALNRASVEAVNGFFRSANNTLTFSKETLPSLARLEPQDTGASTFTFGMVSGSALTSLRNPTMTLTVSVSGRRLGEGRVAETVTSTITRTIKVATDLQVEVRGVRSTGPFTNTGPLPPQVDTESTYTILLSASNTVNSVASGIVRMTLPSYVRYTGKTSGGGTITYNQTTREVVWNIGDIPSGAGSEAAFQVALLPSISQRGTSPVLVGGAQITGFDRFVQEEVTGTFSAINTQISSDPAYTISDGAVQ